MIENISYVPNATDRQTGDLYLPEGSGPHPAAVVLHGGGWSGRDRSDMEDISTQLAENGIAAFNVNYRLAPEHRFPAQLEDTRSALQWIVSHTESYDLDPNRLYPCVTTSSKEHSADGRKAWQLKDERLNEVIRRIETLKNKANKALDDTSQ